MLSWTPAQRAVFRETHAEVEEKELGSQNGEVVDDAFAGQSDFAEEDDITALPPMRPHASSMGTKMSQREVTYSLQRCTPKKSVDALRGSAQESALSPTSPKSPLFASAATRRRRSSTLTKITGTFASAETASGSITGDGFGTSIGGPRRDSAPSNHSTGPSGHRRGSSSGNSHKRRKRSIFSSLTGKTFELPHHILGRKKSSAKVLADKTPDHNADGRWTGQGRNQATSNQKVRSSKSPVSSFGQADFNMQEDDDEDIGGGFIGPIPEFGDVPGFPTTKPQAHGKFPHIDLSSGAAARAAAAAQNEILENIRRARLSESKMSTDTESGIGIERGEEEEDSEEQLPVVRRDPVRYFPPELMEQVLALLDAPSVMSAELVSSGWYRAASAPQIWKQVFQSDFNHPAPFKRGAAPPHQRRASRSYSSPQSPRLQSIAAFNYRLAVFGSGAPRDWKGMWRARKALDKRWQDGHAAAIYLEGHTDSVYCVQFDDEKIITGSRDRTVRIWSSKTFQTLKVLGTPSRTSHKLQPLPGDDVIASTGANGTATATNTAVSGHCPFARVFPRKVSLTSALCCPSDELELHHTGSILCLQYDDRIMVTGSSDHSLIIWDMQPDYNYVPLKRLSEHTAGVLDVCFDERHIVSCSKDAAVCLWSRETGECLRKMVGHRGPVNAVQLRGDLAVSASGDGISKLWNLRSGLCIKEFSSRNRGMACVEFSLDSRTIFAGGNDHVIYQFDANTGELVCELKGHTDLVRSLHLDNGSGRIVSGSYDSCVKAFDLASGDNLVSFNKWTASWILSAKADYRRIIATSQDGRAVIMDFGYDLNGIELLEE